MTSTPKLTAKQKGTILAAIVTIASILVGASEVDWGSPKKSELEPRVKNLEIRVASESTKVDMILEDTRHMRQRLDNFFDSH